MKVNKTGYEEQVKWGHTNYKARQSREKITNYIYAKKAVKSL